VNTTTIPNIGPLANLEGADLGGADLRGADLRGADLRGADLQEANLEGADLREADLREANLEWADLRGADLRGADLREANLEGAYLEGANLKGAYLEGTTLNWRSHCLVSEVLFQAADADLDRQMVAAWLGRRTDLCWQDFLRMDHPARQWALETLAAWVKSGDDAPRYMRRLAHRIGQRQE